MTKRDDKHTSENTSKIKQYLSSIDTKIPLSALQSFVKGLPVRAHLALLSNIYLQKILLGEKTVESRVSKFRIAPFQKLESKDILILKRSSGPIIGLAVVTEVKYYEVNSSQEMSEVFSKYKEGLCINEEYITQKLTCRYATFIFLEQVQIIPPVNLQKSDRRAWIVLNH